MSSCIHDTIIRPKYDTVRVYNNATSTNDPFLINLKKKLIGKWEVSGMTVMWATSTGSTGFGFTVIDCNKEQQFDFVKNFTIDSTLKVTNNYYCRTSNITYLEIGRERDTINPIYVISERDIDGNIIRIYQLNWDGNSSDYLTMETIMIDYSYFHLEKIGSILNYPLRYTIIIKKEV